MNSIKINDIEIEILKKDIKNVHLSVHPPGGRVRLAAPKHMNEEAIRLFAISKLSWIKKQREMFENQDRQSAREYLSGESHYFTGNRYMMNVIRTSGKQHVEIKNKYINIHIRGENSPKKSNRLLSSFYRNYLKSEIPKYIEKWERILDVKVLDWGVKLMKTKWGTCNIEAKRIWINLELAKKPPRCLEYIIVHEMMHFVERHHNDRFKKYLDDHLPNWRNAKDELNETVYESSNWEY